MRVTKADNKNALDKLVLLTHVIEAIEKRTKQIGASIWEASDISIEDLEGGGPDTPFVKGWKKKGKKSVKEIFEDYIACCDELENVLEGAKETIVDKLDDTILSLVSRIQRFDSEQIQRYYFSERMANMPLISKRARQIKPLFTKGHCGYVGI